MGLGIRARPSRRRDRSRLALLGLAAIAVAVLTATLSSGALASRSGEIEPTHVDLLVVPNPISIGQQVWLKGVVYTTDIPSEPVINEGNVEIHRFSGPDCTLVDTVVNTARSDSRGEYGYTETPSIPPPFSYRADYVGGGDDNDGDAGEGNSYELTSSTCVTVGSKPDLSGATVTGDVKVDGRSFKKGVIKYGARMAIDDGSSITLGSSVGHVSLASTGSSATVVASRATTAAPTATDKNRRRPIVDLHVAGGAFTSCKSGAFRSLSGVSKAKKPERSLWAHGKGHYRTTGNFSSATVRGTSWLMRDTCAGTLTKVFTGVVLVTDFTTHKVVAVKAGHSYLARPPQG